MPKVPESLHTSERRLAAILAADIAGYSRLMGQDEVATVRDLKAHQAIVLPMVARFGGTVIDTAGDGILAEYPSAVRAMECAVAIQQTMAERNKDTPPERRMLFRIGINLGDIIHHGARIYGDGVNIAARLEALAEPGGICVSRHARDQVRDKLAYPFADLGEQPVKNIARPVRAFSLSGPDIAALPKPSLSPLKPRPGWRLPASAAAVLLVVVGGGVGAWRLWPAEHSPVAASSIAVLPFDNYGGDEQSARLADGMTEDVITDLARFGDLLVIARNSTMTYKGRPVDVRQVGRDLNVRYVLEGSIQHQADELRVTAQLIDASIGAHVWSERWDRPAKDMFAVQSEVAEKVAASLGGNADPNVGAIARARLLEAKQRLPANLTAYDLALLAYEQRMLYSKEANAKGFEYVEKAIALDPNFAPAYVTRAWLKFQKTWLFDFPWALQIVQFEDDLRRALALDPSNTEAHAGLIRYFADKGQFAEASAEIDLTLRDNPANIAVLALAAQQLPFLGRPEEAVPIADLALRLDPQMSPGRRSTIGSAYFYARRYARHIEVTDLIPDASRERYTRLQRAASYAFLGRAQEAERAAAELVARNGIQVEEIWLNEGQVFARSIEQDIEHDAFRKLGLRICATAEELKRFPNPKRYPECEKG